MINDTRGVKRKQGYIKKKRKKRKGKMSLFVKKKKQEVENIKEKGRIKIQLRKRKCLRENFTIYIGYLLRLLGGFFLLLII